MLRHFTKRAITSSLLITGTPKRVRRETMTTMPPLPHEERIFRDMLNGFLKQERVGTDDDAVPCLVGDSLLEIVSDDDEDDSIISVQAVQRASFTTVRALEVTTANNCVQESESESEDPVFGSCHPTTTTTTTCPRYTTKEGAAVPEEQADPDEDKLSKEKERRGKIPTLSRLQDCMTRHASHTIAAGLGIGLVVACTLLLRRRR